MRNPKQGAPIILILIILTIFAIFLYNSNKITGQIINQGSEEMIIVPVKIHVIEDFSRVYSSNRDEENIFQVFKEVNKIWQQANIYFQIEEIVLTKVDSRTISNTINGNPIGLYDHENFDKERINVFFTKNLNGINGLAISRINSIFVSDHTTVKDYRATAHEFGHIFSLKHVPPINRLMAQGRNGEILNMEEIEIARENTNNFI